VENKDGRLAETRSKGVPSFFKHPPPFVPLGSLLRILRHQDVTKFINSAAHATNTNQDIIICLCGPEDKNTESLTETNARKILGSILISVSDPACAVRYLLDLCERGVTDKHLPFGAGDEILSQWDKKHQAAFWRSQWQFLAPQFDRPFTDIETIDSFRPLPLISWTDVTEGPEYTNVMFQRTVVAKAQIHGDHIGPGIRKVRFLVSFPGQLSIFCSQSKALEDNFSGDFVAIKCPDNSDEDRDMEIDALQIFQHDYAIEILAAFRHQNQDFIVFPFAHGGTLRDIWRAAPQPNMQHEKAGAVDWFEQQCLRAAKVFECLHGHPSGHFCCAFSTRRARRPIGIHGDISPRNLLFFRNPKIDFDPNDPTTWGSVKVGDFGSTLFFDAKGLKNVEEAPHADPHYRAPESDIADIRVASIDYSAKADVWSLGCVWLECITWLVLGQPAIASFTKERKQELDAWENRKDGNFFRNEVPRFPLQSRLVSLLISSPEARKELTKRKLVIKQKVKEVSAAIDNEKAWLVRLALT
jgi:serine/threonine protein kinase